MAIRFEPLNEAEKRSTTHFCKRCESWQKRGELHHCVLTEAWNEEKAAWWANYNALKAPASSEAKAETCETASALNGETFETEKAHETETPASTSVSVSQNGTLESQVSVSTEAQPWEAEGVSRSTYFRRKRAEEAAT